MAKQFFDEPNKLPDYIDDKDFLAILNCKSWVHDDGGTYRVGFIGIWISLVEARNDAMHGFCRATNLVKTIHIRLREEISELLNSSECKFQRDLWFATSQTIQVPPDYFSKRLRGFLIPAPSGPVECLKIHSLYHSRVSGDMDLVLCPLLPLCNLGGLVGVATFKVHNDDAAIIFGYPPGLMKPFAKVVIRPDHEALP